MAPPVFTNVHTLCLCLCLCLTTGYWLLLNNNNNNVDGLSTFLFFQFKIYYNIPSEYSVGQFFEDARQATRNILDTGRVPIVVGGTGLYLRWYVPPINPFIWMTLQTKYFFCFIWNLKWIHTPPKKKSSICPVNRLTYGLDACQINTAWVRNTSFRGGGETLSQLIAGKLMIEWWNKIKLLDLTFYLYSSSAFNNTAFSSPR